jgi:Na+/H+ antiporter NhaA
MQFNQRTELFWAVVGLSLPTFVAFAIVITALLHPNMSVYLLIPLTAIAPISLVCAIIIVIGKRHSMGHQLSRLAWTVLALAVLAGVAAIGIVKLT